MPLMEVDQHQDRIQIFPGLPHKIKLNFLGYFREISREFAVNFLFFQGLKNALEFAA